LSDCVTLSVSCAQTASKATILAAADVPVPKDKFQEAFGESYDVALKDGRVCNAMEACKAFGCTPSQLDEAWQGTTAHKFGGGFYCGRVTMNGKSLYVFNAFFMSMRAKFVAPGTSIYCYEVEWSPSRLPWSDFRGKVLGPTDPSQAPEGSLRQLIFQNYASLGLQSVPNKGDNGVHASASPFEGLAERSNWLGRPIEAQPFGKVRFLSFLFPVGVAHSIANVVCVHSNPFPPRLSWMRDFHCRR
jgi:hypothetical protein